MNCTDVAGQYLFATFPAIEQILLHVFDDREESAACGIGGSVNTVCAGDTLGDRSYSNIIRQAAWRD